MIASSVKQGLEEAITFAKANCPQAKVHQFSPVDVKNVRTSVGMTHVVAKEPQPEHPAQKPNF